MLISFKVEMEKEENKTRIPNSNYEKCLFGVLMCNFTLGSELNKQVFSSKLISVEESCQPGANEVI